MGPIQMIIPLENYSIDISLSNGHRIILDMSGRLSTIRFYELANPDVFRKVYTDGYSIIWKNGKIMMSFGEIIEIIQSVNVLYRAV